MTSNAFEGVKTAKVNGTMLAYCEQGVGEPVVFVHGALSDLRNWVHQLPAIGASYRAISYSRRYARPNEDIDPGADDQILPHVEDLAVFLREIDAAPAHLVGNSWGAYISLLTAIHHPDAVRSLVLGEPGVVPLLGLSFPPRVSQIVSLLIRRPKFALTIAKGGAREFGLAEKAFRRGDDETGMRTFMRAVLGEEFYRRVPESRFQQARENVSTMRAQLIGSGPPPLSEEEVRGVRVPSLVLTGEQSSAGIHLLMDLLEELLPNVDGLEIPNASHDMHLDNPTALNNAILEFLERHHQGEPVESAARGQTRD
jgi:pimeloyl-ACP methyl ester carboxylesterase